MNGQPNRYLLDTNTVVSLLRGHPTLLDLTAQAKWLGVSIITQIEFLAFSAISENDIALFTHFLERVDIVDLAHTHHDLVSRAITLRQEQCLKLPDAVIVASAIVSNAVLITADRQLLNLADQLEQYQVSGFSS